MTQSLRFAHVALAGNPNSGKTSVLNALTGLRQRVGNYPGVTVDVREGSFEVDGHGVRVVDLPGTYSLGAPRSEDERLARDYLLQERPDVVVNVLDMGNLTRHLCFTLELLEMGYNLVVALNFADEARRAGLTPDPEALSAALGGVPVVLTEGHRGTGAGDLKKAITAALGRAGTVRGAGSGGMVGLGPCHAATARAACGGRGGRPAVDGKANPASSYGVAAVKLTATEDDEAEAVAVRRHSLARQIAAITLGEGAADPTRPEPVSASDRLDRVLAHRSWGLVIFAAAMYAVFWITFAVGAPLAEAVEGGIGALSAALGNVWPQAVNPTLRSLLLEGVLGGVGSVLVFLPNIVLLFTGVSLLEDSGYMARAAFLVDRMMRAVGLQGRSFVPMVVGLGCSVPGIMAARTLDNERDRLATMFVVPLVPCGARVPIFLLLIPAFLPAAWRAPALMGVYALGLGLAALVARLLKHTALRGSGGVFVLELPPYRWPSMATIAGQVWTRASIYLRKAATVILFFSVLMWTLSSFPVLPEMAGPATAIEPSSRTATQALEYSFAGRLGKWLEPVFRPLGFDWRLNTALIGAMAAKELFVAQMGIIHTVETEGHALSEALRADYSPATGLAVLVFALVASPCVATFAVMRRESGRRRWAVLQWVSLTAMGYVLAAGVHLVAGALGTG